MIRESSPAMERSIAIVCRNLVREQSTLLSIGRFDLIRTVGRGSNGVVYEASSLLLAGVAALRDRRQRAIAHLDAAIASFTGCEAGLLRDSARYWKGVLLGGAAGRALTEPVISALRDEGVADPRRFIAWLASGFRGIAGGER